MTHYNRRERSYCDWCEKPRYEWTNRVKWRGLGTEYCSLGCYSAGEYQINRYLCAIMPIILGLASVFVVSMFLTNLTTATIFAIASIVVIYLLFSSASLTCVVLGRNKRMLRNSEERNYVNEQ